MKIYVFELSGKIANWRRFYTNSSSLTYFYPTRTNIIGLLASILKLPRDSYYEEFSSEKLDVAIRIGSPLRKQIQVLNYRSKISKTGYTQIKLEVVFPKYDKLINYKLYLHAKDIGTQNTLENLKTKIEKKDLGYGVYLGQRQFRADIQFISMCELTEKNKVINALFVDSVVLKRNIHGRLDISNTDANREFIKRYNLDLIPLDFDNGRNIKRCEEVVSEPETNKIQLIEGNIINVYQCGDDYISFI
ncbi:MAG: CRISPR-associated protein Cas5 [archaeon]